MLFGAVSNRTQCSQDPEQLFWLNTGHPQRYGHLPHADCALPAILSASQPTACSSTQFAHVPLWLHF